MTSFDLFYDISRIIFIVLLIIVKIYKIIIDIEKSRHNLIECYWVAKWLLSLSNDQYTM